MQQLPPRFSCRREGDSTVPAKDRTTGLKTGVNAVATVAKDSTPTRQQLERVSQLSMWVEQFLRETMVEVLDAYSHSPKPLAAFELSGLAVLLVQVARGLCVPALRSTR